MSQWPLIKLYILHYLIDYLAAMCPVTLRLIMNMYISRKMQLRFSNILSSQFTYIGKVVKQGGVLSPILFTVYLESLIKALKQRNIG